MDTGTDASGVWREKSVRDAVAHHVGIGLRSPHYREILNTHPALGWVEVHSENYFGDGGQPLYYLEQIASLYPLSLHGVGLSLASAGRLNRKHLAYLRSLVTRFNPVLVSDHLSWGAANGRHLNDLLPIPYTEETLLIVCDHVDEAQDFLRRQFLIENISAYIQFRESTMTESTFLAELVNRTGCGILLDVNNLYVNAINHKIDPLRYLEELPSAAIKEIHLAGFEQAGEILIDTHGTRIAAPVWELYQQALDRFGVVFTLIEWDTDIPSLGVLLDEAAKAMHILESHHAATA